MPIADRTAKASTAIVAALALALLAPGSVVAQEPPFELVPGDACPLSEIASVDECLYIRDGEDDLLTTDGQMLFDSDPSVDVAEVWFATTTLSGKDRKAIDKRTKRAGERVARGAQAKLKKGQPVAIAMYKMYDPVQCDGQGNLQSWFAFDGSGATRLGPGAWANLQAGTQTLSMGGRFGTGDDTSYASITTDLTGVGPGKPPQWGNAKARDFVWCDEATEAIVHVSRVPKGATSVALGLISDRGDALAQDRVGVPTDTVRIPLSMDDALPSYSCSSIVLRPASGDDPAGAPQLVGMMVWPTLPADPAQRQEHLDALIMTLSYSFFSEGAITDQMELVAYSAGELAWAWAKLDAEDVAIDPTPSASEARRSARLLQVEEQLGDINSDVALQGDPRCGRFKLTMNVCDLVDADAFAATMRVPLEGVTEQAVVSSDGSYLCLLRAANQSEPFSVLIVDPYPYQVGALDAKPLPPTCRRDSAGADSADLHLNCGEGDIKSVTREVKPKFFAPAGTLDLRVPEFDRRIHVSIDRLRAGGVEIDPWSDELDALLTKAAQNASESLQLIAGTGY